MIDCQNHIKVLLGSQFGIYQNPQRVYQLDLLQTLQPLVSNGKF